VEFTGPLSDDAVRDLYRRSAMVLLPGEEDFGIVPVEAQACGTPVVALGRGGALETVVDGETGVLTADGVDAFAAGIRRALQTTWSVERCHAHAGHFATERFVAAIGEAIVSLQTATPEDARW
jgi:glycosyltransferase involved in cell wall biosynthesis